MHEGVCEEGRGEGGRKGNHSILAPACLDVMTSNPCSNCSILRID